MIIKTDALKRSYKQIALWGLLCILLIPSVWYSLSTPFALVDDYGMSCIPSLNLNKWLKDTFWGQPEGRYRPFFEIYQYTAWSVLGADSALHHAARWLLQLAGFYFAFRCLSLLMVARKSVAPLSSPLLSLPVLLLAYMYFLFPNQPAARLGPQEVNTVFFLLVLNYGVGKWLLVGDQAASGTIWQTNLLLYLSFIGLSLSKEVNVAVLAYVLFFFAVWFFRHRAAGKRIWHLLPLLMIFLYTLQRVWVTAKSASYGTAPLSRELIYNNIFWIGRELFQAQTSLLISGTFIALLAAGTIIRISKSYRSDNAFETVFMTFLYGEFAVLYLMICTSWAQVLRYWYPLVPLMGLLLGANLDTLMNHLEKKDFLRRSIGLIVAVFLVFFALSNYHNFLMQYATQHNTRTIEDRMLNRITERLRAGQQVVIRSLDTSESYAEQVAHAQLYFSQYLPRYFGDRLTVLTDAPKTSNVDVIYVSPPVSRQNVEIVDVFINERPYWWLEQSKKVSAFFQGGAKPFVLTDAGSGSPRFDDYGWYLYREKRGQSN